MTGRGLGVVAAVQGRAGLALAERELGRGGGLGVGEEEGRG